MTKRSTLLLSILTFIGPGLTTAVASSNAKKVPMKKKAIATKKLSTIPNTIHKPMVGEIIVKCAGIAKAGMNHCGANGHTCSGKATADFDKNEWIYVRKEVCDSTAGRIVGKKRISKG